MILLLLGVLTLVIGIMALVKGEVAVSKKRVVRGGKARFIGGLLVAAMPIGFLIVVGVVLVYGDTKNAPNASILLPLIALLGLPLAGIVCAFIWAE